MSDPRVTIRFDGRGTQFFPTQTLAGSYHLESVSSVGLKAIEISVLWHTDGKGDEDMGVHHFRRLSTEDGDWIDPRRPGRFHVVLPHSPLSYDGVIVKIRWCVRVRVYLNQGKEIVGEKGFELGSIPPAPVPPE